MPWGLPGEIRPTPPIPVQQVAISKPFLQRLPRNEKLDLERLRVITDKLSSMINSLVGKGNIARTGLEDYTIRTGCLTGGRAPNSTDDVTAGATVGCLWIRTDTGTIYICSGNGVGAATWLGPFVSA